VEKLQAKRFQPVLPEQWDQDVTLCVGVALLAIGAVWLLERWGSAEHKPERD
jgi:hypothetical protein